MYIYCYQECSRLNSSIYSHSHTPLPPSLNSPIPHSNNPNNPERDSEGSESLSEDMLNNTDSSSSSSLNNPNNPNNLNNPNYHGISEGSENQYFISEKDDNYENLIYIYLYQWLQLTWAIHNHNHPNNPDNPNSPGVVSSLSTDCKNQGGPNTEKSVVAMADLYPWSVNTADLFFFFHHRYQFLFLFLFCFCFWMVCIYEILLLYLYLYIYMYI